MNGDINHQIKLAARPVGLPKRSDWQFTETPLPEPGDGEVLAEVLYLSLDPAMRGWMNEGKSYIAPVGIGEVMRAGAVGKVMASRHPGFAVGDHVCGLLGVQEYAALDAARLIQGRSEARAAADVSQHTRHARHDRLFRPAGCWRSPTRAIPSSSPALPARLARPSGKSQKSRDAARSASPAAPRNAATSSTNSGSMRQSTTRPRTCARACARIVPTASTSISTMSAATFSTSCLPRSRAMPASWCAGPSRSTTTRRRSRGRATISRSSSIAPAWKAWWCSTTPRGIRNAINDIAAWIAAGKLKSREDIVEGLEKFPEALLKLFSGENFGKLVLKVVDA